MLNEVVRVDMIAFHLRCLSSFHSLLKVKVTVAQSCLTLCEPMNQGKLEVVKQEMARVNINILGISELKWTGMGEFNSDDLYIYYCEQESFGRNGVAIIVNKRVQNAVLGCSLENDRMISGRFQGRPFNITVQVYALTSNAEEAEVERFDKDLQRCPFYYWGLECKSRKSRNTWSNRQIWPWSTE